MPTRASRAQNEGTSHDATAPRWHGIDSSDVLARLEVDPSRGLAGAEIRARRARHGENEIAIEEGRSFIAVVASQLADFMIIVLLAAAAVSGALGELSDALAIVVIVVLNAAVGAMHEYRAQRAITALRRLAPQEASVVREGRTQRVKAAELVPGDIVVLAAGDVVPADLRLLSVSELHIDEAALTGESLPVSKIAQSLADDDLPIGDRLNLAFKSTSVTEGKGTGIVVATGFTTEIGRIARMLSEESSERTPLQQRLAVFGRRLALLVLAICAFVFASGIMRGGDPLLMFLTAVSLAVAAIPEALPAVVTVALALGARKLSRAKSLVRNLPAVETLGSVTYICTDKTGTLTENRMAVDKISAGGARFAQIADIEPVEVRDRLGQVLALCNDVDDVDEKQQRSGGTEHALSRAAHEAGYRKAALSARLPKIAELPFNTQRKRMTTFHRTEAGVIAFMKGAPERVLSCCTQQCSAWGEPVAIDDMQPKKAADELAQSGYRVLAIAFREFDDVDIDPDADAREEEFTLIGFVALNDPIRPEVPDAVRECVAAGVTPVMMTGDHPETARDIARRLGLLGHAGRVVTGAELSGMSDEALAAEVEDIRVYARVDPAQKIRVVRALQQRGEFVAMTGDGVNDAPSLKQASIGIAMGQRGTDVAREAADIVLLDDNFSTIVAAIREGRHVYDNIRKFVRYTMSSNLGEILVLIMLPFVGYPVPLLPIHLLWINLVTDGLPGLAFSAEPVESGIMRRPPRSPAESIFGGGMWQQLLIAGVTIGSIASASALLVSTTGSAALQTMVFTTVVVSQLFNSFSVRTERDSLITAGLFSNPYLLGAIGVGLGAQLAIIYVPIFNEWFSTAPLSLSDLGLSVALSAVVFVVVELQKVVVVRLRKWS